MRWTHVGRVVGAVAIGAALAAMPALAQGPKGGGKGMHRYDKATESTVKGTVEALQTHQGQGGGTGLHFDFKSDSGILDVHVGPTKWLAEHNYTFAQGDVLEITGSTVKVNGKDAFLARVIKKGDVTITLRNADGVPFWSGMGAGTT